MRRRDRLKSIFSIRTSKRGARSPAVSPHPPSTATSVAGNTGSPVSTQQSTPTTGADSNSTLAVKAADIGSGEEVAAFHTAIQRHCDTLSDAEKQAFQDAARDITPESLISQIEHYDRTHKAGSRFRRHTGAISTFLEVVQRLLGPVRTAAQADPNPSSLIVGAIDLVLLSAVETATIFDRLVEMMSRLQDYLDPLANISKAATTARPLVNTVVVKIYGDLLKFWIAARNIFVDSKGMTRKHLSVRSLLRVHWEPFEKTFGEIQSQFKHHCEVLHISAVAEQLSHQENVLRQSQVNEKEQFLNWISSLDFEKRHDETFRKKHSGTGSWLIDTNEFQEWFHNTQSSLLWCHGKAGAGKSVLFSNVVEHITSHHGISKSTGIAFAYFDYKNEQLGNTSLIVESMVKQLCRKVECIPQELLDFKRNSLRPSLRDLQDLFNSLAKRFDMLFLLVDALDECLSEERSNIIEYLCDVVYNHAHAKVFIASRKEDDLLVAFEATKTPTITIEAESVAGDIVLFVRDEVKNLRQGHHGKRLYLTSDDLEEKIVTTLVEKANGMFLSVQLHLEHLQRVSRSRKDQDIELALRQAPTTLEETFARIVKQIDSQPENLRGLALRSLRWALYAAVPLKTEMFCSAVAVQEAVKDMDQLDPPHLDAILDACANLVEEVDGIVRPIHYSVQQFFTGQSSKLLSRSFLEPLMRPEDAHGTISSSCLYLLQAKQLQREPFQHDWSLYVDLLDYPHLWYCARFFDHHMDQLSTIPSHVVTALRVFLESSSSFGRTLQLKLVRSMDFEYMMADFRKINFPVDLGVFMYCSKLRDKKELRHLFTGVARPEYALHIACHAGILDAVATLLEEGCDVNQEDNHPATPLIYASAAGHYDIVDRLLTAKPPASVNICNIELENPLGLAARYGHKTIVNRLLQAGADINAQGGEHGNALQAAAHGGGLEVVECLLRAGADINAQGGKDGNALQAAAYGCGLEVVECLLRAGADINAQGGRFGNALQAAAWIGDLDTMKCLLKAGADISAQGGLYGNALQAAAASGKGKVVSELLNAGADVNTKGGLYGC